MANDLYDQWISFCKGATPGTRYWLNDELYERLATSLLYYHRFSPSEEASKTIFSITYKGGYRNEGLTFYPKSIFPNPPRKAPGRQEFYAR